LESAARALATRPATPAPAAARDQGGLFIRLGTQTMSDSTAWEGIDEPVSLAIDTAYRASGSHFGSEFGLGFAGDSVTVSGVDVSTFFVEFYGGARYTWDVGSAERFHPYLGAGLTYVFGNVSGDGGVVSEDDSSLGVYVHGGAYYRLGSSFSLGLDARSVSGTSGTFFGVETDLNYTELGMLIGWGF
jgi:opacity protein-like surface antigen